MSALPRIADGIRGGSQLPVLTLSSYSSCLVVPERLTLRQWLHTARTATIHIAGTCFSNSGRMLKLTNLEAVALSEIAKQHPALAPQIAAIRVLERENTGCGFFTTLAVNRSAAAAIDSDRVLGNVWLNIRGFKDPMTFLVFMEDGFISCLEGAAVGDRTDHINLSLLRSEGLHTTD